MRLLLIQVNTEISLPMQIDAISGDLEYETHDLPFHSFQIQHKLDESMYYNMISAQSKFKLVVTKTVHKF